MRNKRLIILLSVVAALVLVIIVCGATFLVRHVEAYNYYEDSSEYDERVIDASGIKMNSSMFFIDETAVQEKIENKYPNIGVVNIERKFPDRVSINYVVYDNLFQYLSGDTYYQCYSSGRIGGTSKTPLGGYFLVRPRDAVSKTVGAKFQSSNGYDYKLIKQFTDYLHTTALGDKQIVERISFVDLTRDGYFYVRTAAGCSIEIRGTGDDFKGLLDGAWSIFVDPDPDLPVSKASGIIRAYVDRSVSGEKKYRFTYDQSYDQNDYKKDYLGVND